MITTIVTFRLPQPMSVERAKAVFQSTAPKYLGLSGLIRKYYIVSEDGLSAGGVYLWTSREAADAAYTDEWRAFVTAKYGAPPQITVMHSPVLVDNTTHQIVSD